MSMSPIMKEASPHLACLDGLMCQPEYLILIPIARKPEPSVRNIEMKPSTACAFLFHYHLWRQYLFVLIYRKLMSVQAIHMETPWK